MNRASAPVRSADRSAGKPDAARRTVFGQRPQMRQRQFPVGAGAVLGAFAEDFRREHAVDAEQLELDRIAARIRRRIHKGAGAIQVAAMVARCFGNEDGVRVHLTKIKDRMAKKRLTIWAEAR